MSGTVADAFPKAAFDEIEFFYTNLSVKGGIRHAIHEFPHTAGGEIEKMGRRPYVISFTAPMHDIPGSALEKEYPNAYPTKLRQLREKFEQELTADLVVPTVGTIKAVATTWSQTFDAHSPSGEIFSLEFIEDQDAAGLVASVEEIGGAMAVVEMGDELLAQQLLANLKLEATLSLFQQINDLVTGIQGLIGQADAFSRLIEGKIQGLVNLCAFADDQLAEMQDPSNHLVVDALKDLWLAAQQLGENVAESRQTIRTFTVPKVMTVGQIAARLYGSTERTVDILQLNGFDDAFAIPAGTPVKYVA